MIEYVNQFLEQAGLGWAAGMSFLGNSLGEYLIAGLIFIIALVVLRLFKIQIIGMLRRLSKKTKSDIDDMLIEIIDTIGWPLYIMVAIRISSAFLVLPETGILIINTATLLTAVYYIIKASQKAIDFSVTKLEARREPGAEINRTIVDLIKKALKGVAWLFALLFVLSGFGVDITGAVVGLGVGGIVIGFALQNILGDLFASFSIYFDRPFEKGDFIIIGADDMGVVENIGLMTTRIKHLKGHELVVSNSELIKTRVNNYKKMKKRRIVFSFGLTYDTPGKKLRKVPGIVREIVKKAEHAELDRVHFKEFGDFSLDFEVVYYVDSQDYNVYMDTQQEINFMLKERIEKEKMVFAFPTQTIFLEK